MKRLATMACLFGLIALLGACNVRPPNQLLSDDDIAQALDSNDQAYRLDATRLAFSRGVAIVPALERAGAKQIAPFGPVGHSRLNTVYSLLIGLAPNEPEARAGYKTDSMGVVVDADDGPVAAAVLDEIAPRYGFKLEDSQRKSLLKERGNLRRLIVTCYVELDRGRDLRAVMKAVLCNEPDIKTVTINLWHN